MKIHQRKIVSSPSAGVIYTVNRSFDGLVAMRAWKWFTGSVLNIAAVLQKSHSSRKLNTVGHDINFTCLYK